MKAFNIITPISAVLILFFVLRFTHFTQVMGLSHPWKPECEYVLPGPYVLIRYFDGSYGIYEKTPPVHFYPGNTSVMQWEPIKQTVSLFPLYSDISYSGIEYYFKDSCMAKGMCKYYMDHINSLQFKEVK